MMQMNVILASCNVLLYVSGKLLLNNTSTGCLDQIVISHRASSWIRLMG